MLIEKVHQWVVEDDDGILMRWRVTLTRGGYQCEIFGLDELGEAQLLEGRGPDALPLAQLTESKGAVFHSDIEAARRFFATEYNVIRQGRSFDFFELVDPVRFNRNRIESAGYTRLIESTQPHPWIADGIATHALAAQVIDSEGRFFLWQIVLGRGEYSVRTWSLALSQLGPFEEWITAATHRLASEPAPPMPAFALPAVTELSSDTQFHALRRHPNLRTPGGLKVSCGWCRGLLRGL